MTGTRNTHRNGNGRSPGNQQQHHDDDTQPRAQSSKRRATPLPADAYAARELPLVMRRIGEWLTDNYQRLRLAPGTPWQNWREVAALAARDGFDWTWTTFYRTAKWRETDPRDPSWRTITPPPRINYDLIRWVTERVFRRSMLDFELYLATGEDLAAGGTSRMGGRTGDGLERAAAADGLRGIYLRLQDAHSRELLLAYAQRVLEMDRLTRLPDERGEGAEAPAYQPPALSAESRAELDAREQENRATEQRLLDAAEQDAADQDQSRPPRRKRSSGA